MTTHRTAVGLAALVTAFTVALAGCQQSAPPTTAPSKETDIRIRTPGVDVDVKGKNDGSGKDVNVDVNRKDKKQ